MRSHYSILLRFMLVTATLTQGASAQVGAPPPSEVVRNELRPNKAVAPAPPLMEPWAKRAETVLQRAREHPGTYDIVFIGDSITEFWEREGTNVWQRYYGPRKCLNLGVSGDRTQTVLWRFTRGQLQGLKPKAVVLMIGTNNSPDTDNTERDILGGVQTVVAEIRKNLPSAKVLLLGIFPRDETFSVLRGRILQINQALAKLEDGTNVHYLDLGSQLIERDGSISREVMRDYLHLTERGYAIWAEVMEPILKRMLVK